ncbi:hypothetical protein Ami103574_13815 [Aminipila butyrica]|uniref:Lipoprotein n=1 Tax=Aminipila butyrica TaxID=433296 RepID=A0A858BW47_9FIRM|nr:hypothetical protein [Aminipila butyrica]QIB70301.1 hypothetical protein Ami103574_13815 [Aminipila butyrica]
MKKMLIILLLIIFLTFYGCTANEKVILKGSYQSEVKESDNVVLLSFQEDDSSFVEYIDNREVDKGTYEKIKDNIYKIKSDKQDFEITLDKNNSFEIIIKKLNDGNPIRIENVGDIPVSFTAEFNDTNQYKTLLDSD